MGVLVHLLESDFRKGLLSAHLLERSQSHLGRGILVQNDGLVRVASIDVRDLDLRLHQLSLLLNGKASVLLHRLKEGVVVIASELGLADLRLHEYRVHYDLSRFHLASGHRRWSHVHLFPFDDWVGLRGFGGLRSLAFGSGQGQPAAGKQKQFEESNNFHITLGSKLIIVERKLRLIPTKRGLGLSYTPGVPQSLDLIISFQNVHFPETEEVSYGIAHKSCRLTEFFQKAPFPSSGKTPNVESEFDLLSWLFRGTPEDLFDCTPNTTFRVPDDSCADWVRPSKDQTPNLTHLFFI